MALTVNSRKRTRSENECDYAVQSKQFISEQTVNMNDETKMKEIHGKCDFTPFRLKSMNSIVNVMRFS